MTKQSPDDRLEKEFELFKSNVAKRGVYLIFEKKYLLPGSEIPPQFGPSHSPHYRLLSRKERREQRLKLKLKSITPNKL
jgi:hypothetical protein